MFKVNLLLLSYIVLYSSYAYSKAASCAYALQTLSNKVEENYAGYPDKDRSHIELVKNQIDEQLGDLTEKECVTYLEQWLDAFSDPIMRIRWQQDPPNTTLDQVNNQDNQLPTIKWLSQGVALLSLPSFNFEYSVQLRQVIEQNYSRLKDTEGLIIDLRGNEGRNFFTMYSALQLIGTYNYQSMWHVLSSTENTTYYRQLLENELIQKNPTINKLFTGLLEDMTKYPNTWIEFSWPHVKSDARLGQLQKVFILQDETVGSSAEEFILATKSNPKVVTYGHRTQGTLDYAVPVPHKVLDHYTAYIPSQKRVWYKFGAINGVGIAPEVSVSLSDNTVITHLHQEMQKQLQESVL